PLTNQPTGRAVGRRPTGVYLVASPLLMPPVQAAVDCRAVGARRERLLTPPTRQARRRVDVGRGGMPAAATAKRSLARRFSRYICWRRWHSKEDLALLTL